MPARLPKKNEHGNEMSHVNEQILVQNSSEQQDEEDRNIPVNKATRTQAPTENTWIQSYSSAEMRKFQMEDPVIGEVLTHRERSGAKPARQEFGHQSSRRE